MPFYIKTFLLLNRSQFKIPESDSHNANVFKSRETVRNNRAAIPISFIQLFNQLTSKVWFVLQNDALTYKHKHLQKQLH